MVFDKLSYYISPTLIYPQYSNILSFFFHFAHCNVLCCCVLYRPLFVLHNCNTGCLPFLTLQLFQAARPLTIYLYYIFILF